MPQQRRHGGGNVQRGRIYFRHPHHPAATDSPTAIDGTLLCDATSNNITINLPAASTNGGVALYVKKIDASANTVTIDANASETIDGALTKVISTQYNSFQIQCNGTAWFIL